MTSIFLLFIWLLWVFIVVTRQGNWLWWDGTVVNSWTESQRKYIDMEHKLRAFGFNRSKLTTRSKTVTKTVMPVEGLSEGPPEEPPVHVLKHGLPTLTLLSTQLDQHNILELCNNTLFKVFYSLLLISFVLQLNEHKNQQKDSLSSSGRPIRYYIINIRAVAIRDC